MKKYIITFLIISQIISYNSYGSNQSYANPSRPIESNDEKYSCGPSGWRCRIVMPIERNYYDNLSSSIRSDVRGSGRQLFQKTRMRYQARFGGLNGRSWRRFNRRGFMY